MKTKHLLYLSAMLAITACQQHNGPVSAQSDNSNNARLEITVNHDSMTITLTNLTDKEVLVDRDMEIMFAYEFSPNGSTCIGEDDLSQQPPLTRRLQKLAPGGSICRTFRSGEVYRSYSSTTGLRADGLSTLEVSQYRNRMPDFSKTTLFTVEYGSSNGGMAYAATSPPEEHKLLESLLSAWVTARACRPGTPEPYEPLRGDKEW